jgi:hypothetical protein
VKTEIVSINKTSVMAKHNAKMDLMKVTNNVASRNSISTTTKNVVASTTNGNVNLEIVSPVMEDVMVNLNVMMVPMKEMSHAASKTTHSTTTRDVDASRMNGPVLMVLASNSKEFVMEVTNALMDLMKVKRSAASRITITTTLRSVAAIQTLNSHAPTENASKTVNTVMEKLNAPMDLMKVTDSAASRNSLSTTTKNVAAKPANGNVTLEIVSLRPTSVMVLPNAQMSLMKETRSAASRTSNSTMSIDVDVIHRLNGPARMVTVLTTPCSVTEKPNALINLMKVMLIAASENSLSTTTRDAAARDLSSNVPTETVSSLKIDVMVNHNVLINLMKVTNNVASRTSDSTTSPNVAATQLVNSLVPTDNVSVTINNVTVNHNAQMVLMKVIRSAASETFHSTTTKNVAAKNTNGNVLTVNASTRTVTVMVMPNVLTNLMKVTNNAATEASTSITVRNVAATQNLNGPARMVVAS